MNIIASGHFPDFEQVGEHIVPELLGSFEDWNELKGRGHEIMPHSWKHLNLTEQPFETAQELMNQCLDYFEKHLEGYTAEEAIFNFPTNYKLGCRSNGPDNIDEWVRSMIDSFLADEGGWLILTLHGLDEEGRGLISSPFLNELLGKLVKKDFLEILPAGEVLAKATGN